MRLFLLRHAHAKDVFPDEERPLSVRGCQQIAKVCAVLNPENFLNIAQIWHSPYARATQTATQFKELLGIKADLVKTSDITPLDNPQKVARMISAISCFGGDLMIVSHNPLLESLAQLLIASKPYSASTHFGKCTLAALSLYEEPSPDCEFGLWTLDCLITPAALK